MIFYFSTFTYDVNKKQLSHDGEAVEIPKKCHELLIYLLENSNALINREALIEHIWHGRVVTHNTIDQTILKLRRALNQTHAGEYIESVYGQGIRFLPVVRLSTDSELDTKFETIKNHPSHIIRHSIWPMWLLLFLTMAFMFIWLSQTQKIPIEIQPHANDVISQTTNQSIDTNNDPNMWLITGSHNYLRHLLNQSPNITLGPSQFETDELTQSKQLIIKLNNYNHSLKLKLSQDIVEGNYLAHLELHDAEQLKAEITHNNNLLIGLFAEIKAWVSSYYDDAVADEPDLIDPQIYTEDEQALQSHFQGMALQRKGMSEHALPHFQNAVDLDPAFKTAWYELALATRKTGDPRKALSILNAIQTSHLPLAYQVALTNAQTLDVLLEFEQAKIAYDQALDMAKRLGNNNRLAAVYISQGIFYRKTKQYESAQHALEQAELLVDPSSQLHLFGTIMNTQAKLARDMNQPLLAIEKSKQAIKAFQQADDIRYEMQAKTTLASILRLRNDFDQAEQLVKESLFYQQQINNQRGISDNQTKLAKIYQQTGQFRLAIDQWQKVLSLTQSLQLHGNSSEAYLWLMQLHLTNKDLTKAKLQINLLEQLVNKHLKDNLKQILTEASLIFAIHQKDLNTAELHFAELGTDSYYLKSIYQGDMARLRGNNTAAEVYYLEALLEANSNIRFDQITQIRNRLSDLYLAYQPQKLTDNLNATRQLKPFIYPLQKYQALSVKLAGNHIKALSLMEELKLKAGDYWQDQDEELLEKMRFIQE